MQPSRNAKFAARLTVRHQPIVLLVFINDVCAAWSSKKRMNGLGGEQI
jgi:hypothetical protein